METLIYLKIEPGRTTPVDADGKKLTFNPGFQKDTAPTLRFRLRDTDGTSQYPAANLANISSWYFVMANDWDSATPVQVKTIVNISLEANETNTDLVVSLTRAQTNTSELIGVLNKSPNVKLKAEFGGLEPGEDGDNFAKTFELAVYNRLESTNDPTPLPPNFLTPEEIYALLSASKNNDVPAATATAFELGRLDAGRGFNVTAMFTDEVSGNDEGASLACQVFLSQGVAKLTNKNGFSEIANLNIISGIDASITGTAPDEVVNLVITTTAGNALKMNFKSTSI